MADSKITALTALTSLTSDDLVCVVDSPGSSPVTKKITAANFAASILALSGAPTLTASSGVIPKSNGTNLIASSFSDDGVTISASVPLTVNGIVTLKDELIFSNGQGEFTVSGEAIAPVFTFYHATLVGGDDSQLFEIEGTAFAPSDNVAIQRFNLFKASTIDDTQGGSPVVTTAATVAIVGPPTVTGTATITNPYSLWVQTGNVLFAGLVKAGSSSTTLTDSAGKILSASLNTVAVANGGTGITSFGSGIATFLGTPTSANFLAAISNETGGGLVMGNNTPTIITPSFTTGFTIAGVATSRKIIVGNGTNFVASTETYAVPGTSGNVLTSDGTNWTSAAPAGGGTTINSTDTAIPYRSNSTTFADSPLLRTSANVIDQRNSTNAQTLNVYGSYTDASNYIRTIIAGGSNYGQIALQGAGTGLGSQILYVTNVNTAAGSGIQIQTSNSNRWMFDNSGNLLANGADNAYDLGASGATRPRAGYFGTSITVPTLISTAVVRLKGYTVATLPAGTQGDTAFVTDALAPTFLATVVGGGAVVTPVFYNGTNWVGS